MHRKFHLAFAYIAVAFSLVSKASAQFKLRDVDLDGTSTLNGIGNQPTINCGTFLAKGSPAIIPLSGFSDYSSRHDAGLQSDSTHFALVDTEFFNSRFFKFDWWPSYLGAGFFITIDELSSHGNGGGAVGMGYDVRVGPVFAGVINGISENDGLWDGEVDWKYQSIYCGAWIDAWRIDINSTHVGDYGVSGGEGFITASCDVSRRFEYFVFVEPEIRIMFPIASHYSPYSPKYGPYVPPVTVHYHLRDLFIGLSLKIGIGFN